MFNIFGWICIALLVAYWLWVIFKPGPTTSSWIKYLFPSIVTLILGGMILGFGRSTPPPDLPVMLGGRGRRRR